MGRQEKVMVKIQDKQFRVLRENTGACEAASRESLEKENSCLQMNTKFKQRGG